MTLPGDQYPSKETVQTQQHFDGEVIPEYRQVGHETITTPMLRTPIRNGDTVVVAPDAVAPRLGDFMGTPIAAQLELGGDTPQYRAENAFVVRVTPDNENPQLRSFLRNTEAEGVDRSQPFYMVIVGGATISGFTIVKPSTQSGLLGRHQNNMTWFDASGKAYPEGNDTVVMHNNRSVSREQLVLGYDATGGLRIGGRSENSPTILTTVATEEHRKIVDKNEAAKKTAPAEVASDKTQTAGKRLARLLSRRRSAK